MMITTTLFDLAVTRYLSNFFLIIGVNYFLDRRDLPLDLQQKNELKSSQAKEIEL